MPRRKKGKAKAVHNSQAKLNLFLDILQKRDDGFHEIETIIAPITLSDNLIYKLTDKSEVKVYCTSDSLQESDNIIYKIACFLKETYDVQNGVEIKLKKNIPLSAGLGGGSSNAADTIHALNTLWELHLSDSEMHTIVAKFGSDINFFLNRKSALLKGRGEIIERAFPSLTIDNILLVNPGIEISSRNAYSWVQQHQSRERQREKLIQGILNLDVQLIAENLYNGLEPGVFAHYPVLEEIKLQMMDFGALGSLMSGSGSTVFSIFPSREKILEAEKFFKKYNYWLYKTKIEDIEIS